MTEVSKNLIGLCLACLILFCVSYYPPMNKALDVVLVSKHGDKVDQKSLIRHVKIKKAGQMKNLLDNKLQKLLSIYKSDQTITSKTER